MIDDSAELGFADRIRDADEVGISSAATGAVLVVQIGWDEGGEFGDGAGETASFGTTMNSIVSVAWFEGGWRRRGWKWGRMDDEHVISDVMVREVVVAEIVGVKVPDLP